MSDLRRRGGRAKERSEGAFGGAEKKRRGDRAAAIKYNYFPIKPSATILFHCPSGRGGGRDSVANRRECNYPGLSSVCRDANNNDMSTGVIA